MSVKNLIVFLFMVAHAVNALYPTEYLELSRAPAKVNFDSLEEAVTDALIDELKSRNGDEESDKKEGEEIKSKSESEMKPSESRIEDSWLEPDSEPSSLFDDPNENDALHSRNYATSHKRDDYYENLEKKSLRSTYAPPPRKTFYTTPHVIDASASEEYIHEERIDNRPPRAVHHHDAYYPEKRPDSIRSESYHLIDSIEVAPTRGIYQGKALETPPWRLTTGRSYSRRQNTPVIVSGRPKIYEPAPDPVIPTVAVQRPRNTYKAAPPVPRYPVHVHKPKIHYNDEAKFKALPRSKPWITERTKEPVFPKFKPKEIRVPVSPKEGRVSERSSFGSGFGRPIRQQFHEQGTRGPHSYKFGYNTGDKENPMARYEERDADGIVRGSYSYIDARGQKQVVHYESHPKFGFKTKVSSDF